MGRQELHSSDTKIEQKPDLSGDLADRESDIVRAEQLPKDEYLAELAFNEEPMTIRIEPGRDKNAALHQPIWVGGVGAEILLNGRWLSATYLPVGVVLTTKRKYVAVLASAKQDSVETVVEEKLNENPTNNVRRMTSSACVFSVIEDKNPKGAAWLTEILRRNA